MNQLLSPSFSGNINCLPNFAIQQNRNVDFIQNYKQKRQLLFVCFLLPHWDAIFKQVRKEESKLEFVSGGHKCNNSKVSSTKMSTCLKISRTSSVQMISGRYIQTLLASLAAGECHIAAGLVRRTAWQHTGVPGEGWGRTPTSFPCGQLDPPAIKPLLTLGSTLSPGITPGSEPRGFPSADPRRAGCQPMPRCMEWQGTQLWRTRGKQWQLSQESELLRVLLHVPQKKQSYFICGV